MNTSLAHGIVLVFTYFQGDERQRESVEVNTEIRTELIEEHRIA